MDRIWAVVAVTIGTALIGFNPDRWDPVLFALPRGSHGIHVRDAAGVLLIALGTGILWRSRKP